MVASDFRKEAREKLEGKWGKVALLTLVYFVFDLFVAYIMRHTLGFLNFVVSVLYYVVNIPIAYGLVMTFLKLFKGEDVGYFDCFTVGFDNFSRSWSVVWHTILKILVPVILFVVSYVLIFSAVTVFAASYFSSYYRYGYTSASISGTGVALLVVGIVLLIVSSIWLTVKSYYYSLSQLIAMENPEKTPKEAVEESRKLMEQKRWKLFCLQFSFIGWAILAVLTFGIGMLWLLPYMQFATIAFYKNALGSKEAVVQEPVQNTEE